MQKQQHCWRWGGLQRAAPPSEAALRSVCFFHYLAGGLCLFGAGDFWQPGEEEHTVCTCSTLSTLENVDVLLWVTWTYCRCLRRALLRSSLMYSDIRPWAKRRKSSVSGKNTAEGKQRVCVRPRSIIVQYCCHLLASCGSANAKRNKSVEFRPVNKILSLLLIIYPHRGWILSSLWCMLWIWPLLPLRCFSSSVQ